MNQSKINQNFLGAYIKLDRTCSEKFGGRYGVTEYINKLTDLRFVIGRKEVLPLLTKYRKIRNKLAHEPDALEKLDMTTRDDIKWLEKFERKVAKGRDPLSKYLKRAGAIEHHKALLRTLSLAAAAGVAILALGVIFKAF